MENFKHINTKKQYIDKRLELKDSMLLFIAYDLNDDGNLYWFEYINDIKNIFNKLDIIIFSKQDSDDKLKDLLKDDSGSILYPSVVLCHPHLIDPQIFNLIEPYELYKLLEEYNNYYNKEFDKERDNMFEKIKKLLSSHRIITFIKGTPQDPFCKFSKSFVEIINKTGIKYKSFNIFLDEGLRCWLRLYSGWKTYPQLYIDGKIIGGVDIMKDLIDKGEFMKLIPDELKS